jgi:hypothetical protein
MKAQGRREGCRERRYRGRELIDTTASLRTSADAALAARSRRQVYALDSGRGQILRIDPRAGNREDVAFCPRLLRGLSICDGHAIVTVSKPRNGTFKGLLLNGLMQDRDAEPWWVELGSGDIVEWIRLERRIT